MSTKLIDLGYSLAKLTYKNLEAYDANGNELNKIGDFELILISPSYSDDSGFQPAESVKVCDYNGKKLKELAKEILNLIPEEKK